MPNCAIFRGFWNCNSLLVQGLSIGEVGEVGFQSARKKVGTHQKEKVGPEGPFCAIFSWRRAGKALVGGKVMGFWVVGICFRRCARDGGNCAKKRRKKTEFLGLMTEKDRKRGSKVGKIAVFCVKMGSLARKVRALV